MKKNNKETRSFGTSSFEGQIDSQGELKGYAAIYNEEYHYQIEDERGEVINVIETILPGAFTQELINKSDVRGLFNHSENYVIGRSKYGNGPTMTVIADERGLYFKCTPPKSRGDVVESVERGDVDQCSFKFVSTPDNETLERVNENTIKRSIHSFSELFDITISTFPAYKTTVVRYEERSMNALKDCLKPSWKDESELRERQLQMSGA